MTKRCKWQSSAIVMLSEVCHNKCIVKLGSRGFHCIVVHFFAITSTTYFDGKPAIGAQTTLRRYISDTANQSPIASHIQAVDCNISP